jgi:AraC-like DNA-binding protein
MHYRKLPAPPELSPYIECFFEWEGTEPERIEVQSPPNGRGAIIFNYGDPTSAFQHNIPEAVVPEAFICGIFTTNFHRVLKGKIGMFGIVFRPYGIHNVFGLRMSTLVNNRMPLELLVGHTAHSLLQKIREAPNGESRSHISFDFLSLYLKEAQSRQSVIDETVDFITEKDGIVQIDEVANKFSVSKRYIEKQFLNKVGISPKLFARLTRFTKISLKVAYSYTVDWQDLVLQGGYHDQSHLNKEFIDFNKQSPETYLQTHHEMTRFVKK